MITLRVAIPEDRDLLDELIAASYATLAEGGYDAAQLAAAMPLMARANPRLLESGTYYVATDRGEAAGCGGWSFETPGSHDVIEGVAHIRHFATHPAHKRKGVARMLILHCLKEAHAAGARLMKAQSTLPGEAFYASAGFRHMGAIEVEMGPGVMLPAIEMERLLP